MSPLAISLRFLQTQPDHRLLELARAGHERAFEALVHRYRRQLLRYCRRLTASEASAEDVLQQGLLQAWIALSTGETDVRDPRAWLYRIVHNVAITTLRRAVHDPLALHPSEGGHGADYEVERRLVLQEALTGLAALPELQRQAILSTAFDGRSHDEVAAALGLSHGAVRGLIYRARATLRAAAAALTPSPLVHWVARQTSSGSARSSAVYEALAGGGSAGLGGVLLKGGAVVVTAGALAAAGINSSHSAHRSSLGEHARVARSGNGRMGGAGPTGPAAGASDAVARSSVRTVVLASLHSASGPGAPSGVSSSTAAFAGRVYPGSVSGSGGARRSGGGGANSHGRGPGGPDGSSSGGQSGGGGSSGPSGSPGASGTSGGSGGSSGSGSSGGDHGGSSGGSDGGGSGVAGGSLTTSGGTTATTLSDGSGDRGGDTGSGDHGGSASTVVSSGSSGGGGSDGGSGGGGSDGATTTATATTSNH